MRIAIIGSGSWGCALAACWGGAGHEVVLWCRDPGVAHAIASERRHPRRLLALRLPETVRATSDMAEALSGAETAVLAVPSAYLPATLARMSPPPGVSFVSAIKGIDVETGQRPSQTIGAKFSGADVAVLSGPTFAEEVARGEPAAAVLADAESGLALRLQRTLSTPSFRLYRSGDRVGVELAGAYKNVVAIGAGILTGLGYGHNTLAALVTRGLAEMTRLAVARGGRERTLFGLAGVGDLMLTCTGRLSRNRRVGEEVCRGRALAEILDEMPEVAEGTRTCRVIPRMAAESAVETPIAEAVRRVLYEGLDPRGAIMQLMIRELKEE
jgi:glycerol-3-phosphate dehydrogenase (NAD(P)+)